MAFIHKVKAEIFRFKSLAKACAITDILIDTFSKSTLLYAQCTWFWNIPWNIMSCFIKSNWKVALWEKGTALIWNSIEAIIVLTFIIILITVIFWKNTNFSFLFCPNLIQLPDQSLGKSCKNFFGRYRSCIIFFCFLIAPDPSVSTRLFR